MRAHTDLPQSQPVSEIELLLPDFVLIAMGVVLYRKAQFGDGFWSGVERLVYFILFPALLFQSTATVHLDLAATWQVVAVSWIVTLTGIALAYSVRLLFRCDATIYASGLQTAFRFNSYMALAIAGRLGGSDGVALMALLIGVNVPLCNVAAVYALARHGGTGALGAMMRNPLLIATVSGLTLNATGLHLPEFAGQTLGRLGSASIALGLIAVGAGLRIGGTTAERPVLAWWLVVKLALLPAIAFYLTSEFALLPLQREIVVMLAAMPTASSSYILATRMGGNGAVVAFLISAGTALSAVTLPFWLGLVR
jgi:malonate transporter and related proteins